tara:strand:- start:336 stop:602 length:267 start_codon:yes stop_codon:yes gene_type:complete
MNVYDAIQQMRALSRDNIPFSIKFVSMNSTKGTSNGERTVNNCLLRTGLSKAYSDKASSLVGYTDLSDNSNKSFYIPLLTAFNEIEID